MTHDFGGSATTHDLTLGFAYNPASQIVEATRSNNLYAWTGHGSGTTSSTTNGLNQFASHGGATPTHDSKGNLTSDGTYTYAYSSENLLTSFGATGTLGYDPLMRFYENYSTYFIHEGGQLVGEYYNGNIVARYVPGAAGDEPVAQIDKFGARTGFHSDERGSIIAGSNSTGANSRIVTYDEYGKRGPGGSYRFAYTGQVHLLNDIYDYKARNYNARLGRFVQTDRIGYGDGMNIYAYVGGDPVNFTDPSGLQADVIEPDIIVTATSPAIPYFLGGGYIDPYANTNWQGFFLAAIISSDGGASVGPLECTLGNGAIDVSFDGATLNITTTINLVGPGADTSGGYIGGIAEAWTKPFGHINSIANISAGPGGITAHVSSGIIPPGGPRSTLGGNEMWLGNLGAMSGRQIAYATKHVAPHEFGHSLKIDNMSQVGKWKGAIMANSANDVSATDLEAVVEACRAEQ